MAQMEEHYANLLAPIYTWMVGGAEAAFALGQADLQAAGLTDLDHPKKSAQLAIDLGAGFGMHAVPLARNGWQVLAIDSSQALLSELESYAQVLQMNTKCDDLLSFRKHLGAGQRAELILCMGDTLTHLKSLGDVKSLAQAVAATLAPQGQFIATFRDYSKLPAGQARFIPVRSDDQRILTCFLEEHADHVEVHDVLHEKLQGKWVMKVSSYRKLRLDSAQLIQCFEQVGLKAKVEPALRGMLRLVAQTR
jgi:SAM-dependent methyltransferase